MLDPPVSAFGPSRVIRSSLPSKHGSSIASTLSIVTTREPAGSVEQAREKSVRVMPTDANAVLYAKAQTGSPPATLASPELASPHKSCRRGRCRAEKAALSWCAYESPCGGSPASRAEARGSASNPSICSDSTTSIPTQRASAGQSTPAAKTRRPHPEPTSTNVCPLTVRPPSVSAASVSAAKKDKSNSPYVKLVSTTLLPMEPGLYTSGVSPLPPSPSCAARPSATRFL
mmetsp:Transcript_17966/g.56882  ORF Transcript_17966/g.56882 Transcript_17966/m.56882 type:complete len:230 (-) Transcript_17966:60-749(-)|eukprot:scaffold8679_cov121-Isochrysis_galbana.AAC.10